MTDILLLFTRKLEKNPSMLETKNQVGSDDFDFNEKVRYKRRDKLVEYSKRFMFFDHDTQILQHDF